MDPTWAPGVSVYKRVPEPLRPQGHEVGEFLVFPSVEATGLYDTNIFATGADREEDFIALVEPMLYAVTRQERMTIDALLALRGSAYIENSNQDEIEYEANVGSTYLLSDTGELSGRLATARQVVDRADVEEGGGTGNPRIAYRYLADAGYQDSSGPWVYGVDGAIAYSDFEDQSGKNRTNYDAIGLVGYQMTPHWTPFVEPYVEFNDFEERVDANGFERNSDRFGANVGAEYVLGNIFTLRASAGVSEWHFADPIFDDEWVWAANALAGWNVTPETTLKLGAGHDEINTTVAGASLKTIDDVRFGVEHAFRPDLRAFADAAYGDVSFNDIGREDHDLMLAVGGEYLIDRMFTVSAGYTYDERDSNVNADFERSVIWLSLVANF